ncbi:hypothetical protein CC86DRAFT_469264 [Ophiobolus disseminans]|uniref:MARVEL domain-containing protein n=1 Tax=Ophiobolus disseminans TaxID=1469910 RepID=A0A6A6ZRR8_9PLEO|nr:hypothetical protein CC86DRAFT_469264 [Ophiobolus disseminans]
MSKVGSPLINWILRAFQALFGIVILGLAVTLIRGHHIGSLPSSLGFAAFVGGVTIIAALIGIAAVWLEFLDGIVGLAVDSLVAVLNVAGGIFLAIKLKGVSCKWDPTGQNRSNNSNLAYNDLFSGGCEGKGDATLCANWFHDMSRNIIQSNVQGLLEGHCRESRAAMVFMFMAAVLLLASGLMGFLKRRKGY